MPTDVQQSSMAVAVGVPAPAAMAARADETDVPVPTVEAAEAKDATPVPDPIGPVTPARRRSIAVSGYVLLILATALAVILPRMRMRAGIGEDLLVILSILGMIAGAGMVFLGFVWNVLREL